METITSATSWLSTATTTWVWGVVPVVWDKVIIATWHTVTLAWTHTWWDDTSTGITINWILKASRTVNSQLTARGDVYVWANGYYDWGTEADRIPTGITHKLLLNNSATMANNKWGFRTDINVNTWAVSLWWEERTPYAEVAIEATATDTIITFDRDLTGWAVGDFIVFWWSIAQNSSNGFRERKIEAISGRDVTISGNLGYVSQVGRGCINVSSNVKVQSSNPSYQTHFTIYVWNNHSRVDSVEIWEVEFNISGAGTSPQQYAWAVNLYWNSNSTSTKVVKRIYRPKHHVINTITGSTVTYIAESWNRASFQLFWNQAYQYQLEEPVASWPNYSAFWIYAGSSTRIVNPYIIRPAQLLSSWFSQWSVGWWIDGWILWNSPNFVIQSSVSVDVNDMVIDWLAAIGWLVAYGSLNLNNITVKWQGFYGTGSQVSLINWAYAPVVYDACTFPTGYPILARTSNINNTTDWMFYKFRNKNNSILQNELYRRWWQIIRDNSTTKSSTSSLRFDCWYSDKVLWHEETIPVSAWETITVKGFCRFNTTYGTTRPPTVTISWMGATPVTFTCPTTANVWNPVSLTITNPQSYPWSFTIRYEWLSAANTTGAYVYFDGMPITDFVNDNRHYGYKFENLIKVTANPYISETDESVVGAYSGISINHSTDTITITSPHSIEEIYDYVYYDLCQTANLSIPEYFTTDWATYTTSYNIVNNSTLSGTGTLITTGTYTWSGITTLVVKDSVGVRCKITSGWSPFTIKGATISYEDDITEKIVTVTPNTDVSFVMYKIGYKPQLFTINSGALGGTFNISMLDITEAVDVGLNVAPIIALTSTTVDMSGYHIFFGEMELSLEQMKAVVHRLMKYENYFDAVLATSDDNIVEVRSDEIRVNKPLFTIEREASLTLADRVQLNGYINISNAVTIDHLYIINPWDTDWLYVTYLTVKPWIDAEYLAWKVWENPTRTLTEAYTPAQIADAVWDEPLTWANHNVPTSAWRRLRQLGALAVHDWIAQGSGVGNNQIQLDTGASTTNGAYDPSEIAIVWGTWAWQSRLILQYNGSTRIATVDRNWRVNPDNTSEFIIYVNSGREHVNEWLAQGGTSNSITLNANASSYDNAYNWQIVFLRSGTGEDQVARVTAYNGTTKVATIETAIGSGWAVTPDTTTGYVVIPYIGGSLSADQSSQLLKASKALSLPQFIALQNP